MTNLPEAIAGWFIDSGYAVKYAGCQSWDGLEYSRDSNGNYCDVWVQAFVDMDLEVYFLLETRTYTAVDKKEWRDYIFLSVGGGGFDYKSYDNPVEMSDVTASRLVDGLNWMTSIIQELLP